MPLTWSSVVIGVLLFIAGYFSGRASSARDSARKSRESWRPNSAISDADIEAELRAGRKIHAIKLYRQRDGSGLKEAKQAVDAIAARLDSTAARR